MLTQPGTFIEWRARRISDPMERLKYLRRTIGQNHWTDRPARRARWMRRSVMLPVLFGAVLLIPAYTVSSFSHSPRPGPATAEASTRSEPVSNVWIVDKKMDVETFSNGLHIDNRFAVSNTPRPSYPVFARAEVNASNPEWSEQPAGIVYHTTESDMAPLEAGHTTVLKRLGKELITFVARNHSYHFVIDRFGRVFRAVRESDTANHAGNSVWADEKNVYVNLNTSFLGVSFETQTLPGESNPSANQAQILSARLLTQMLRSKYKIAAANCVTHAQVSVNPSNKLIGYHTDWAGNFPFLELGLTSTYTTPPASMYAFGFGYDPTFVQSTGARLWQGLLLAEDEVRKQAARRGLTVPQYREILQKRYKDAAALVKENAAPKEKRNET